MLSISSRFFVGDGDSRKCPWKGLAPVLFEHRLHFLEPEAQLLGALDEHQQLDVLLRVSAVLSLALRGGQQADGFIVADAFDGASRESRGLTDVHESPFLNVPNNAPAGPAHYPGHSMSGDSMHLFEPGLPLRCVGPENRPNVRVLVGLMPQNSSVVLRTSCSPGMR